MPKNAGKIDIEMQEGSSNLTPFGGLCLTIRPFYKMGLDKAIDVCVGARNGRGAKDSEHVLALVLLNLVGCLHREVSLCLEAESPLASHL